LAKPKSSYGVIGWNPISPVSARQKAFRHRFLKKQLLNSLHQLQ